MRKELPLVDPPFKHLLRVAYRVAILLTMENTEHWIYSNHIQIGCDRCKKEPSMVFVHVPFIIEWRRNVKTQKKSSIWIDKIVKKINRGVYVLVGLDEYYMPSRPSFMKRHFKHNVLIYGYDSDKQVFLIQGYSERDIYEVKALKFDDFKKAFTYYKNTYLVFYYKRKKKPKESKINKNFNERLYCHYKSFYPLRLRLFSARSFCKDMSFGIKSCGIFKELIYQQIELCRYDPIVLKGLLAISEQKHCIAMGYRYLCKKKSNLTEFINFFENLSNEYLKLRNLELKFKFNQNPDTAKKIIDRMDQLIEEENNILKNYFNIVGSPFRFY